MARKVEPDDVTVAVRKYQELLGMKDWNIEVSFTPDAGNHGECQAYYPHKKATISINLDLTKKRSDMEATVRHELFHVLHWQFCDIARKLAGKKAQKVLRDLEEDFIDQMEHWPLWKALDP